MVRHIVMFKLKEFASPIEKQAKLDEIKARLEALKDKIEVLKRIEVKFNWLPWRMSIRMPTIRNTWRWPKELSVR